MKRVISAVSSIFNVIHNEINGGIEDRYVRIPAVPAKGALDKDEKEIVPFARLSELPDLGPDRDMLIAKAERLFKSDDLRLKWLNTIHDMDRNEVEWIMKPMTGEEIKRRNQHAKLYPKWTMNPTSGAANAEEFAQSSGMC